LRGLCVVNCPEVLLHGRVVIATLIQEIPILAVDGVLLQWVDANLLRKIDSKNVEIAFIEYFKPLLEALLSVSKDL